MYCGAILFILLLVQGKWLITQIERAIFFHSSNGKLQQKFTFFLCHLSAPDEIQFYSCLSFHFVRSSRQLDCIASKLVEKNTSFFYSFLTYNKRIFEKLFGTFCNKKSFKRMKLRNCIKDYAFDQVIISIINEHSNTKAYVSSLKKTKSGIYRCIAFSAINTPTTIFCALA